MLFYLLLNLLLLSFSVTRCNKTKSKFSLKWPKSKHNSFSFKINILKNITISRHIFGLLLYETLPPRTFKSRPNWSHCCRSTHFSCFCWCFCYCSCNWLWYLHLNRCVENSELNCHFWICLNLIKLFFCFIFFFLGGGSSTPHLFRIAFMMSNFTLWS